MFQRTSNVDYSSRSVGVLKNDVSHVSPGLNLICISKETYLLDVNGMVVHEWSSSRDVFCAKLRENGNLVRDGGETQFTPSFRTGGAAGYIEEVDWRGQLVWCHVFRPSDVYLTHHDIELMPNGNVLVLIWEKCSKDKALNFGRRPELIPQGEVWNNIVVELKPNGKGGADIVWQWSLWDHIAQDYDPEKAGYVSDISKYPYRYDINYCPPGGKSSSRNTDLLKPGAVNPDPSHGGDTVTGERDWIHCNSLSYDPERDQVMLSFNPSSEIIIIDHSTSMEESKGETGGRYGLGGSILYRWGNPMSYRLGTRSDQVLFCQHSVKFIRNAPGDGRILLFNNGRIPDRHWSSIDEIVLPETHENSGIYVREDAHLPFGPASCEWSYGPRQHHQGSFYCTHISGVQRLPNGNNLITMGPQGIVCEVTMAGAEVWRYVSPGIITEGAVSFVRQGTNRPTGARASLFRVERYPSDLAIFVAKATELVPKRYLEA